MKPFTLVFGGLGAILLIIAGILYMGEQSFLDSAEPATGIVTDLDRSGDDGAFCPVIDFTTRGGEPVRYFGNVCSSPPSYDIGEQVNLLYDPENIRKVQMDNFWSKYVGVFVLAVIGLPFFLIGVWAQFAGGSGGKK